MKRIRDGLAGFFYIKVIGFLEIDPSICLYLLKICVVVKEFYYIADAFECGLRK